MTITFLMFVTVSKVHDLTHVSTLEISLGVGVGGGVLSGGEITL